MVELADALDSGSSGHYARAGSSPVIRRNAERAISKDIALFCYQKTPRLSGGQFKLLAE